MENSLECYTITYTTAQHGMLTNIICNIIILIQAKSKSCIENLR